MSAIVWISGAALLAVGAVIAVWKLRRAARTLEAILAEEAERPADEHTGVPRDGTPHGTPKG